ncbi:hypothetical protein ACE1CI_34105 [Aerosakkonemataceae cyanobacterium BLCC-F50]|uniref:Uncharacterized protein n=1 Tax=Floridaenema flaviceps BLCC-F50 TaxID=3153642 RepID=A0ABV4Y204_9CYAN
MKSPLAGTALAYPTIQLGDRFCRNSQDDRICKKREIAQIGESECDRFWDGGMRGRSHL